MLSAQGFDGSIENSAALATHEGFNSIRGFMKYLFTRNFYERLISYYFNWIVDKDKDFIDTNGLQNRAYGVIRNNFPARVAQRFFSSKKEELRSLEIFELFCRYIPYCWMRDGHLYPQHLIYSGAGMDITEIAELIDVSQMNYFFNDRFGSDAKILNKSSVKDYNHYFCPSFIYFCNSLYRRDFDELGYDMVNTVAIQ